MRIKQEVTLELETIEIDTNQLNHKGKYAAYTFRMISPSNYSFLSSGKPFVEEFTAIWGSSPKITYYNKDYKEVERFIWEKVCEGLPEGFPKDKNLIDRMYINISDFSSPKDNREWCVFFRGQTYRKNGVAINVDSRTPICKDKMSRILAELPVVAI
jgi:hypothetical protein